jgi:hypothetical protein
MSGFTLLLIVRFVFDKVAYLNLGYPSRFSFVNGKKKQGGHFDKQNN